MIPTDLLPLANHLWQSTLFGAAAWLLALAVRTNRAAVRYRIWMAASVKFLIPFSVMVSIGSRLGWRSAPIIAQPQFTTVMNEISRPFAPATSAPALTAPPSSSHLTIILVAVWLCGVTLGLIFWARSLWQIRAVVQRATPLDLNLPIPVMSSASRLEPGIFGIHKPVLLLPEGITDRLTPAQMEAIFAHELCHLRRRDNLTAAIHMLVEILFWFHPLVWWIRTQLVAARESACDEEVIRTVEDPQVYAEGILNVCRFYLESLSPCVSGVTGADLRKRINTILIARSPRDLSLWKQIVLATAGFAAVAGPVAIGVLHSTPGFAQQSQSQAEVRMAFEVASIKPSASDDFKTMHSNKEGPGGIDYKYIFTGFLI
jgi:bla regulator protein BlaR1